MYVLIGGENDAKENSNTQGKFDILVPDQIK